MRTLYDQEYLDSGCTLDNLYDKNISVDDTLWTYATNFAVTAVCLLNAIFIHRNSTSTNNQNIMVGFFVFCALAFGIAGFNHALIHEIDHPSKSPIQMATVGLYSMSTVFLTMAFLNQNTSNRIIRNSVLLLGIGITVYGTVKEGYSLVGTYQVVALFFIVAISMYTVFVTFFSLVKRKNKEDNTDTSSSRTRNHILLFASMKSLAGMIMIISMMIQLLLSEECGADGYEVCFKDCPLPDAGKFNHNALYHVLYLIGVLLFGWAEYKYPTTSKVTSSKGGRTDDDMTTNDEGSDGLV